MSVTLGEQTTVDTPSTDKLAVANKAGALIQKDDAGNERLIALLSSALADNRIVIVDASGQLDADADLTWNGSVLAVGGSNPVTSATLDVAGDIVVSDGAGAAKATLCDDGTISSTPSAEIGWQTFVFGSYDAASVVYNGFNFRVTSLAAIHAGGLGTYIIIMNGRSNTAHFNVMTYVSISKRYNGVFEILKTDLGTATTLTIDDNTTTLLDASICVNGAAGVRDVSFVAHRLQQGKLGQTVEISRATK